MGRARLEGAGDKKEGRGALVIRSGTKSLASCVGFKAAWGGGEWPRSGLSPNRAASRAWIGQHRAGYSRRRGRGGSDPTRRKSFAYSGRRRSLGPIINWSLFSSRGYGLFRGVTHNNLGKKRW